MTLKKNVGKTLYKHFLYAYKGKIIWRNINHKYGLKDTAVIVFPDLNEKILKYGMLYLDKYLEKNKKKKAIIILPFSKSTPKYIYKSDEKIILELSEKKINYLVHFSNLLDISDQMVVLSFDLPNGRRLKKLLGVNGLNVEELIAVGIYRLFPFKKIEEC